ncbi:hypothetical protein [Francisella sciaenopsi]|uniref:hypothetical protein n=1 Tax=Francisella sciaenopsi TaxID=3055034 RepID=UPI0038B258D1
MQIGIQSDELAIINLIENLEMVLVTTIFVEALGLVSSVNKISIIFSLLSICHLSSII